MIDRSGEHHTRFFYDFESIEDHITYIKEKGAAKINHNHPNGYDYRGRIEEETVDDNYGREDWDFGVKTVSMFRKLEQEGWEEGMKRIEKLCPSIALDPPKSIKRKQIKSDQGDELLIDKVYMGELDKAWITTSRRTVTSARYIDMVVDIMASGDQSGDVFFWGSAIAIRAADALEDAGYRVRIRASSRTNSTYHEDGGGQFVSMVTIKDHDAPLNTASLVTSLCHPAFFRVLWFCLASTVDLRLTQGNGQCIYGRPRWLEKDDIFIDKQANEKHAQKTLDEILEKVKNDQR